MCCLQARDTPESQERRLSKSEGLGTRGAEGVTLSPVGQEETDVAAQQAGRKEGRKQITFPPSALCAVRPLSGLDNAHPRWGQLATCLRPPIPMPISPRGIPTGTLRNNVNLGTPGPSSIDTENQPLQGG